MTLLPEGRLLFLAPHPDDFEFGCAGTFLRAKAKGFQSAHVSIFCWGSYVNSSGDTVKPHDRAQEVRASFQLLGVPSWSAPANAVPENGGYNADYPTVVSAIEGLVFDLKATEVFLPLPSFNQDHRMLHDAAVTALRPGSCSNVQRVWAYEYPGNAWGPRVPDHGKVYVEMSETQASLKISALKAHSSQWRGRADTGVVPTAAEALMRQRGAEIGVSYAECLYLLKAAC